MPNLQCPIDKSNYSLGRQMTIEYYDCSPKILAKACSMEQAFLEAAKRSGATIISSNFHGFEPQGVSGVIIIAESHFTVHAWPEHDYAAVDIFTCGESIDFKVACDTLKELLEADHMIVSSIMHRGIVNNNGIERLVPIFEDTDNRYTLSWERRFNNTNAKALMSSVDVYNIFKNQEFTLFDIEKFAKELIAESHFFSENAVVEIKNHPTKKLFLLDIKDDVNSLCGKFFQEDSTAYLDLFHCDYFEPRTVGEIAIDKLQGSNYRMQVAIRQ